MFSKKIVFVVLRISELGDRQYVAGIFKREKDALDLVSKLNSDLTDCHGEIEEHFVQ